MKVEKKLVIQLNDSENNLFDEFLDFLEELTDSMEACGMDSDTETESLFTDLSNAFSLLDRAYTFYWKEEVKN